MSYRWDDPDPQPLVQVRWDEGSRDRQDNLFLLIAICLGAALVLVLSSTEPAPGEPGFTTTTEVGDP